MKLSIVDFNTQGTPFFSPDLTKRYKKIAELLSREKPDIICLQEVATYYHLFLLRKYLTYPFFIYKKFLHGPKGGLVIISKIPMEQVEYKNFATLGSVRDVSFISRIVQNGMLLAKIKNHSFTILNTHTFSDFEFEWSPKNKLYRYVKAHVTQLIEEINKRNETMLVLGDFNMKKNSRLYKFLLEKTKITDIFKQFSFPTYYRERLDYKFKGKTSERIDFVFLKELKKKTQVLSRTHLLDKEEQITNKKSSFLSDHIGLKVNLDIF